MRRRGAALAAALALLLIVSALLALFAQRMIAADRYQRRELQRLQAVFLADAAEQLVARRWAESPDYAGETWLPELPGESNRARVTIRIESSTPGGERRRVVIEAYFPDRETFRGVARRELPWPPTPPGDRS